MICSWLRKQTKGDPELTVNEPRPSVEELEPSLFDSGELQIIRKGVPKMASRGKCPNGLEGLIIHFNAGRWQTEKQTISTIEGGVKNGFTYSSLSRSGILYLSPNLNFDDWGYHAGES